MVKITLLEDEETHRVALVRHDRGPAGTVTLIRRLGALEIVALGLEHWCDTPLHRALGELPHRDRQRIASEIVQAVASWEP